MAHFLSSQNSEFETNRVQLKMRYFTERLYVKFREKITWTVTSNRFDLKFPMKLSETEETSNFLKYKPT